MLTPQAGVQVDKFNPPVDWQYSFPEGYTRLEYLESTGTQYIDTGYVPTNNTKWVLDAQSTDLNVNSWNGRYNTSSSPQRFDIAIEYDSYIINGGNSTSFSGIVNSDTNRHTFVLDMINEKGIIDNTYEIDLSTVTMTSTKTVKIFARQGGSAIELYCKERVYSSKFYESNVIQQYLVPTKRNSDNKPGMYDLVNNVFYVNQGTGEFVMGPALYINKSQIDIRQKNNLNFGKNYEFNVNDELTWANPNMYLTGKVNYTKVGSPTITDGIASGFSASDYLQTEKTLSSVNVSQLNFYTKVIVPSIQTYNQIFICYWTTSLNGLMITSSLKLRWVIARTLAGNDTAIDSSINITEGDILLVKAFYDNINNQFVLQASKDNGINWIENRLTLSHNTISTITTNIRIGNTGNSTYNRTFNSSIDLSQTYIKVNNELWFYGKVNSTSNIAPVPAGFVYNNTTTPSIGIVDMRTQTFTPAPEGAVWKNPRDLSVVPPEDNTITLLYGVTSDFSKYKLFGLGAQVSSGTYDVYIDDVLYATTASGAQTDIDFSTLGSEYVPIGTATTPESLTLHKIVVKPNTSGATITKFRCIRTADVSTIQYQGVLWCHFELENSINVVNLFCAETSTRNPNVYAITAKGGTLVVTTNTNNSGSGLYSIAGGCNKLVYMPIFYLSNKNFSGVTYLAFTDVPAKRVIIKNNGSFNIDVLRQFLAEKVEIENFVKYQSGTGAFNNANSATNLKIYPKIITNDTTTSLLASSYSSLYPTKIDDSLSINRTILGVNGTSTYPMRGLRGLKVSNEAPFSGNSPQINVSYTGLDRDNLVELFNSMPAFMPLTKEGSPNISNGVVSGFSNSDYLQLQEPIKPSTPFEIKLKFNSSDLSVVNGLFHSSKTLTPGSGRYGIMLTTYNYGTLNLCVSFDGTIWAFDELSSQNIIQENVDYYVKFGWTGNEYYVYLSTDDINYNKVISYNSQQAPTSLIQYSRIGIYSAATSNNFYLHGTIDLNPANSYIIINNTKYQFRLPSGSETTAANPQIDIRYCTGNNLTKVGSPTIDENGVASGFSNSDYLTLGQNMTLPDKTEIVIKFTTPSSISSTILLFLHGSNYIYIKNNKKLETQFSAGGSNKWVSGNTVLQLNTTYYLKFITIKNKGVEIYLSTDGINYTLDGSSYNYWWTGTGAVKFGAGTLSPFTGSIDLENTYIKVDSNYIVKGYLTDNDRAIATGKGWDFTG